MSARLADTLAWLDGWLLQHAPPIHAALRPGATDSQLDTLEVILGRHLPPAFRALYRWHDGQDQFVGGVFGLKFEPLEGVRREWDSWQEIGAQYPEFNTDIPSVSHPAGAIRAAHTTPGWLGFLTDGGGNSVGLDLNPGPTGTAGQVITFGRAEEEKYVLADSLDAFVREYAARLEHGRVSVEVLDGPDEEVWSLQLTDAQGFSSADYSGLADLFPASARPRPCGGADPGPPSPQRRHFAPRTGRILVS